jgi:hypothetical protein
MDAYAVEECEMPLGNAQSFDDQPSMCQVTSKLIMHSSEWATAMQSSVHSCSGCGEAATTTRMLQPSRLPNDDPDHLYSAPFSRDACVSSPRYAFQGASHVIVLRGSGMQPWGTCQRHWIRRSQTVGRMSVLAQGPLSKRLRKESRALGVSTAVVAQHGDATEQLSLSSAHWHSSYAHHEQYQAPVHGMT